MAEKTKPLSLNERLNNIVLQSSSKLPPPKPQEEESSENTQKVKIQGRRRLCKLSSKDDTTTTSASGGGEGTFLLEEPNFSSIMDDIDSPQSPNSPVQIRDIVDELSSKLDFLSIQKPKRADDGGKVSLSYSSMGVPTTTYSETPIEKVQSKQDKNSSMDVPTTTYSETPIEKVQPKQDENSSIGVPTTTYSETPIEKVQPKQDNNPRDDVDHGFASADSSFSLSPDAVVDEEVHPHSRVQSELDIEGVDQTKKKNTPPKMDSIGSWLSEEDNECVVLNDDHDHEDLALVQDSSRVSSTRDYYVLTGKPSNYTLPGKIADMLYPHQKDGLKWLWSLHCRGTGGILGDDMGLGKTMQICGFLAGLFHSRLIKRALVVAPKTLLAHWNKELSIVGLSEKTREYYAPSVKLRNYELQYILQHSGILLTTYDIVRNNSKSLRGDRYYNDEGSEEESIIWDYIILDEGHIIKNPSTQRAKSLLELPSSHRIIISGTPIQNNLKELWALFSFCCPELLGDKKEFKERYEAAIIRGNEKSATDREKRIGSTVAKELRTRIEPYFLRRMKSEVSLENGTKESGKLSEKNEMIVWLRLTHCQRQLYEAFLNSELVLSSFDGSPLAAITILKKICDHPFLLTKRAAEDVLESLDPSLNQDDIGMAERMVSQLLNASDTGDYQKMNDENISCKISFIMSLLDTLIPEGHSVLIFSQTRKMLNLVQEAIISRNYNFLRIDGTTKAIDREKTVNIFQEGGAPIFLLTSQVGGLGLTLTKADRVIVVDPAWNPSTDNQSVDRAYRIGQKKDVIVYRLMTCGTIEEKIYKKQVFKGGLLKSATEHKEQTRYFSQQDLRELFSLPEQGFDVSVTQQQLHEEHDRQHIMNDTLKDHIKFLESLGIGGVSHHNLLFSKTAALQDDEELPSRRETSYVGSSSSYSTVERNINLPEYAFNPKDVKVVRKNSPAVVRDGPTESEIKDKIKRLHENLANKALISKLPDKGRKIEQHIYDLNLELDKLKITPKGSSRNDVIDLDDDDDLLDELGKVSV